MASFVCLPGPGQDGNTSIDSSPSCVHGACSPTLDSCLCAGTGYVNDAARAVYAPCVLPFWLPSFVYGFLGTFALLCAVVAAYATVAVRRGSSLAYT